MKFGQSITIAKLRIMPVTTPTANSVSITLGIEPFGIEFANPDFGKLAEAIGLTGIRVEASSDVRDDVNRLFWTPGPALLDAAVDPVPSASRHAPPSARPKAFRSASPSRHCMAAL